MKYILLVPDGAWDMPIEALGGKTPLEVARTPHMDKLANEGTIGMVQTVPEGFSPASDVANMSLLGYPPEEFYSGRAPLEAANIGVQIQPNEVAFRTNFVTVVDGKMVDYSAGHISTQEAEYLIDDLNNELASDSLRFYTGTSYRHLLVIKTDAPEAFMSLKCTPPHNIIGEPIQDWLPQGDPMAKKVLHELMERSIEVLAKSDVNKVRIDLKENPATMIWLWGQGVGKEMPVFNQRYGISGAIISAVDLLKGLGKKIGLEVIEVEGATGYYDTNYKGKAQAALNALEHKDFVMVHLEAPDEAGHNGHLEEKIKSLERFDASIVAPILEGVRHTDFRILISPDHPTPVEKRTHTSDPVGFLMYGKDIKASKAKGYSERNCMSANIFIPSGPELFELFIRG